MICKICGKELKSTYALAGHLQHHSFKMKDYYDNYYKQDSEGICVICGSPTKFVSFTKGYARVCGYKCSYKDPHRIQKIKELRANEDVEERIKKQKQTNLDKYGVESNLQLPNVHELAIEACWAEEARKKRINTNLERYGVENVAQNEDIKQKAKETCLSRYGEDNISKSVCGKQKIKEGFLNKFGVDNCWKAEEVKGKIKQTNLEKFGVEHPAQNPEVRQKMEDTCIKRYNIKNPWQLPYLKSSECQRKRNATMAKNGNRSNLEDYFEKMLIKHGFIDNISYIKEYKEKRYPYFCDFYLPEKDLFIEINGYWTHNDHWFNPNNTKDIELLEFWKKRAKLLGPNSKYHSAVLGWTIGDIKKRDTAKNNSLNYVVLWNKNEINDWFNDGMPIRYDWEDKVKKVNNTYLIQFDDNTYMIVDENYKINYNNNITPLYYIDDFDESNNILYIGDKRVISIHKYDNTNNLMLETIFRGDACIS